ncbi:restriction endonuclease [Actinosynnema sp. NPDC051121]
MSPWLVAGGVVVVVLVWRFVQAHPVLSALIGVALVVLAATVLVVWWRVRRREAVLQAERDRAVEGTDGMSGAEFEQWTARLLRRSGCVDVRVVGGAGDAGADVVASAPDGRRVVVQCKRYGTRNVGTRAVQLFAGTDRLYHQADVSLLVTTSGFTAEARKVADAVGIELVDRALLAEWARTGIPPIPLSLTPPGNDRYHGTVRG